MLISQTAHKSYSWTEFGEILASLEEQLKIHRISKITSVSPSAQVLTSALNHRILFDNKGKEFRIGLDNLIGLPDVVVTKYVHDDEDFQYPEPSVYFESLSVDVEYRMTKVTFPWE